MKSSMFVTIVNLDDQQYYVYIDGNGNVSFYEKTSDGFELVVGEVNERLKTIYWDPNKKYYFISKSKVIKFLIVSTLLGTTIGSFNAKALENIGDIKLNKNQMGNDIKGIELVDFSLNEKAEDDGIHDALESISIINSDDLHIIYKYNLEDSIDVIAENYDMFKAYSSVVEKNDMLSDDMKGQIYGMFKFAVDYQQYLDFNQLCAKLSKLHVYEHELEKPPRGGDYDVKIIDGIEYPVINIYQKSEDVRCHELFHLFASSNNYSTTPSYYFTDAGFNLFSKDTVPRNAEGIPINTISGYQFKSFEEGMTETLNYEYRNNLFCYAYPDQVTYIKALAEIYGSDLLLKAHFSENGIVDLLNEMYASGNSINEIERIFSRLTISMNEYLYKTSVDTLDDEWKIYYNDVLNYQIADDIVDLYKKKTGLSYKENKHIMVALNHFLTGVNFNNVDMRIASGDITIKSEELYNDVKTNGVVIEKIMKDCGIDDPDPYLRMRKKVSLSDSKKYFCNVANDYQITYDVINFQITTLTYDKNDNLISCETKYNDYINSKMDNWVKQGIIDEGTYDYILTHRQQFYGFLTAISGYELDEGPINGILISQMKIKEQYVKYFKYIIENYSGYQLLEVYLDMEQAKTDQEMMEAIIQQTYDNNHFSATR